MSRRTFGTIRNRGGVSYIRYRLGGHEYEERAGAASQAEKLLARKEAEFSLGVLVGPTVKRTRFEDLMAMVDDDYAANQRKSVRQLAAMKKHLSAAFAGHRVLAITTDRLTAYRARRLAEEAAPATIRNELQALHHGFTLAKAAGKVIAIPAFPSFDIQNVRTGFFEDADVAAVLAELSDDLRPVAEFAWLTGWRKREILTLMWAQVDFRVGMVRLEPGTTKNKEGRTYPFGSLPRLQALLERQRERTRAVERREGCIIPHVFHRAGKPIKDFKTAWDSACDRAARDPNGVIVRPQLIGRLVHDFRRTAVRNSVRAGIPEKQAMALSGHRTRSVFDRYDIVNERDLADAVSKLAARGTRGGQAGVSGA